jgi:hypothetical protein
VSQHTAGRHLSYANGTVSLHLLGNGQALFGAALGLSLWRGRDEGDVAPLLGQQRQVLRIAWQ